MQRKIDIALRPKVGISSREHLVLVPFSPYSNWPILGLESISVDVAPDGVFIGVHARRYDSNLLHLFHLTRCINVLLCSLRYRLRSMFSPIR